MKRFLTTPRGPAAVVLTLVLFFPLGLYWMWRDGHWSPRARWIVTGIAAALVLLNIAVGGRGTSTPSRNTANDYTVVIPSYSSTPSLLPTPSDTQSATPSDTPAETPPADTGSPAPPQADVTPSIDVPPAPPVYAAPPQPTDTAPPAYVAPPAAAPPPAAPPAQPAGQSFDNCTALHAQYPHGVGQPGAADHTRSGTNPVTDFYVSQSLYDANSSLDADGDGIACEKH